MTGGIKSGMTKFIAIYTANIDKAGWVVLALSFILGLIIGVQL